MHDIRTTPGFVIAARPYGEADKMLTIFTQDLGLVTATALGIRLEKSKLRYFAAEYSFGIFSLVRGKEFWRLTSAQPGIEMPRSSELIARVALVLRRFLQGEEPHPELYGHMHSLAEFLGASRALTTEQSNTLESLIVLRIMSALGYVGKVDELTQYLGQKDITHDLLEKLADKRALMNKHINHALKESQL